MIAPPSNIGMDIGFVVLDRRQSSPAALAFIALAQGLYPSPT